MNSISNQILTRIATVALIAGICFTPILWAGGTIEIDDTKKISIGVGMRSSFNFVEDANPVHTVAFPCELDAGPETDHDSVCDLDHLLRGRRHDS